MLVQGVVLMHAHSPLMRMQINAPQVEVVDGGVMESRRHLNVRGKSATLPAITDKVCGLGLCNVVWCFFFCVLVCG
jgi:hypothetical protein